MGTLLDLGHLTDPQVDIGLRVLYKALTDDPLTDAIFDEHPSPFIRRLVELFYERGLLRLEDLRKELSEWLKGQHHRAGPLPVRPEGSMTRWSDAELQLVRIYLTALPRAAYRLDDYMLLVDFLVQRYLPASDLRTEADWLATRATLMGRVQANLETLTPKQADQVLAALPPSVGAAVATFPMTEVQLAVIDYARAHAAENVQNFADITRARLRAAVLKVTQERLTEHPGSIASALQTQIGDEFAVLNRDWRRIAVTEAGEAANQGLISSSPAGTKLERLEHYRGSCAFCRKINGVVMEVVAADAPKKNGATQIWPGKTNIGRAAAPRKRVGSDLIERAPHERWWIPAGVVHPHCRGRWVPTLKERTGEDPEFTRWLTVTLGKKDD